MKQHFINEVRAFNRFYTHIIGLVNDHILHSEYSLPEARILFELYYRPGLTASELIGMLDMDKGYLSRILRRFGEKKLVGRVVSEEDRRVITLALTAKGKAAFEVLNRASDEQIEQAFGNLSEKDSQALVEKMTEIRRMITKNNILEYK
ncbi:MAG TPA: MarR family winged helix-turn-helix transcriptional regulator [Puia sp.]|jgi:DNA-binding MarR family transcriptional regulator|nr:MarR family winged helix-turn-helix transcriptional regulator [Puia sp.]